MTNTLPFVGGCFVLPERRKLGGLTAVLQGLFLKIRKKKAPCTTFFVIQRTFLLTK